MPFRLIIPLLLLVYFNSGTHASTSGTGSDSTDTDPVKPRRIYTTIRLTTEKPTIDGVLNDPCWKTGEWAGDYTQWIPREGAKPSHPTQIKILYDDKNIYVAIRAFESNPENITRKSGRRDELNGDAVGINFDSYHDHRTGFEFNITSAGQKIDLMLTNPMNADFNWNAVWYAKTGIEDSAWTAEYEIPLSQLRYSSDEEQVWGMHSWRWIDRLQEESDWEPQSSTGPGMLYQFGELHGIKGLPASRRIEIVPYALGKLKTFKSESGNPFAAKGRSWFGNLGLDAKIGVSSNFTTDLTINPDFGQVESDPSVMNITAFETFYEERRPFFLEGRNIFSFDFDDVNIFYSRRIGHPPAFSPELHANEYMEFPDNTTILGAAKISGKTSGGLSLGVLQSIAANEYAKIDSSGTRRNVGVEPLTGYTIARIQQDFDQGTTILGGILTSTRRFFNDAHLDFLNREAYTAGADFLHQWDDKEYFLDVKVVGSLIKGSQNALNTLQYSSARYYQRPDADYVHIDTARTSLSGVGGKIKVGKGSKGLWRYSTGLAWRSPGLELNDIGFMHIADIITQENSLSYFVNQPVSIFRTYSIGVTQNNNWDFGLRHLSSGGSLNIYLEFLNKWAVNSSLNYTAQAVDNRILRGGPAMLVPALWSASLYMRTDPSQILYVDLNTSFSIQDHQSGRYFSMEPEISLMPMNTLKLSMSVDYANHVNNLQYIDTRWFNGENRYILGKIQQHTLDLTFRIDYNITPELSIQYYGSPFASVGRYSEFKLISNPKDSEYKNRFTALDPGLDGNNYEVSENNNSHVDFTFLNPDFNFSQFRSNLVVRWEYRPGSQLFLVWSQERTEYVNPGYHSVADALSRTRNLYPNNIILVKFNYWFSL
jgi:hypothetical protein